MRKKLSIALCLLTLLSSCTRNKRDCSITISSTSVDSSITSNSSASSSSSSTSSSSSSSEVVEVKHTVSFYDGDKILKSVEVKNNEKASYLDSVTKNATYTPFDLTESVNTGYYDGEHKPVAEGKIDSLYIKTEYSFNGWYTSSDTEKEDRIELDNLSITSDLKLYAGFDETIYNEVLFVGNDNKVIKGEHKKGDDSTIESYFVKAGESAVAPTITTYYQDKEPDIDETTLDYDEYTLVGWNNLSNIVVPTVIKGEWIKTTEVDDSKYVASFKNADGSDLGTISVDKETALSTYTLPTASTCNDVEYTFSNGLKTKKNFKTFKCWIDSDGNEYDTSSILNSNIVLTAKFKEETTYHQVKFVDDDKISVIKDAEYIKEGSNAYGLAPTVTKKDDDSYFIGWDLNTSSIIQPTIFTARYDKITLPTLSIVDKTTSKVLYSMHVAKNTLINSISYEESKKETKVIINALDDTGVVNKEFTILRDNEEDRTITYFEWESDTGECITKDTTFYLSTYTISYEENGLWPQTKVTDEELITKIEEAITDENKDSLGYYLVDGNSYAKNGTVYRKVEPIYWKKLAGSYKTGATMISDTALSDGMYFYNVRSTRYAKTDYRGSYEWGPIYSSNWKYSNVRSYLNTTFLNGAFTDSKYLVDTEIDNSARTTWDGNGQYCCSNTMDHVWLLSSLEMRTYFTSNEARKVYDRDGNSVRYWTRSPVSGNSNLVSVADTDGSMFNYMITGIDNNYYLRPVIQFKFVIE